MAKIPTASKRAKPAAIAVERIDHVTVNVVDLARAMAFYGGVFGLQEIPRPKSFTFPGCWYRVRGCGELNGLGFARC